MIYLNYAGSYLEHHLDSLTERLVGNLNATFQCHQQNHKKKLSIVSLIGF